MSTQPLQTSSPDQQVETALPDDQITQQRKEKSLRRAKKTDIILTIVLICMIVILIVSFFLKCYVVCTVRVSGESMMPNFEKKETVWVDKTVQVKRGDVVVLYENYVKSKFWAELAIGSSTQSGGKYAKLIKRVVALEGDKLWTEEKNGEYILVIETSDGQILYEDGLYTVGGQPAVFWDKDKNEVSTPYLGKVVHKDPNSNVVIDCLGKLDGKTRENPFVVKEGYFFFLGDNRHQSKDSRYYGALSMSHLYGVVISK